MDSIFFQILFIPLGILASLYFVSFFKNTILTYTNDSEVDIIWGFSPIVFVSIFYVFSQQTLIHTVLTILVYLWGIRLFLTIFSKHQNTHFKEDKRYTEMKKSWNQNKFLFNLRRFLQIYVLQFILSLILVSPILVFMYYLNQINEFNQLMFTVGGIIMFIGLVIEHFADLQLKDFIKKKDSHMKSICDIGLWNYSRHPNYFGESLFWLGVAILIIPITYLGFISWAMITFLLLFVSGIPTAERGFKGNEEFEQYKKEVSPFIPWFRKKA
ncbi:MAG: DUF1295 domain-containing protein [Nanoarchaeota archaeon]|nr:DUF1295 domain-containing protein [Nanoarchaeota archaeon]